MKKLICTIFLTIIISIHVYAEDKYLYVPQTKAEVQNFWLMHSEKDKLHGFGICSGYVNYLFLMANSESDLKKLLKFFKYSDGIYAEMFVDYWVAYINSNFDSFRSFFINLDEDSKTYFTGVIFYNLFYELPEGQAIKMKADLKLTDAMLHLNKRK